MFAVFIFDIVAFLMSLPFTTNWLFMTVLFVFLLAFTIIMYGAYIRENPDILNAANENETV